MNTWKALAKKLRRQRDDLREERGGWNAQALYYEREFDRQKERADKGILPGVLHVVVEPAADLTGVWTSECPERDLVSQGDSPEHAVAMMGEALLMMKEHREKV